MKIQSISEVVPKGGALKVAIYGVAGSGKTTFASTFPSPIFLDLNRGLLSIRDKTNIRALTLYNATFVEIKDAVKMAEDDPECKSIIIDTIGEVSEACMSHSLTLNRRQKPEFDDWIAFFNMMKDFIIRLRNSPKNICVICHEMTEKDENTGRIWCKPAFQGQMKGKFDSYWDELYHAEVETTPGKPPIYKLLARLSSIYTAKSRLLKKGSTESYLQPDYAEIIKLS